MPPRATSERVPKCSPPPIAQRIAAVFSVGISFRQARRLLPALPQQVPVRSEPPLFDLVVLRQGSGWARPFSLQSERCVLALLLQPASARLPVQCFASARLRQFASLIQLFSSSSTSELESSRQSEIDPGDLPRSLPDCALHAFRPARHWCTQKPECIGIYASGGNFRPACATSNYGFVMASDA